MKTDDLVAFSLTPEEILKKSVEEQEERKARERERDKNARRSNHIQLAALVIAIIGLIAFFVTSFHIL